MSEVTVELFKSVVRSHHPQAAAALWSEHFHFAAACEATSEENKSVWLNDCRDMFRWLRDLLENANNGPPQVSQPWERTLHGIYDQITEVVTRGHIGDTHYREAALVALDDPDGKLWSARLREWEDSDQRHESDEDEGWKN